MKAVRFHRHGDLAEWVYEDAPRPTAGADEVVVAVAAVALNHLDLWVRQGIPAYPVSLPHIGGADVSGTVTEVGPDVSTVSVGDRVVIAPGISCGRCPRCRAGRDNLCDTYRIFGAGCPGGFSEYTVAPAANIFPIPATLSFEAAAAFPLTFLTAWHMLIGRAHLSRGQDLLVMAGGSGIGSAAIRIGKWMGARVIAAAGGAWKQKRCLEIGADIAIDNTRENVVTRVGEVTGGRGVDVVVEHTGPVTFSKSLHALTDGGTLVTCGATTGPTVEVDLRLLFSREISILGARMGTRAELEEVLRWVGDGHLAPVIDSVSPLSKLRAAAERMVARDFFGKIVLSP